MAVALALAVLALLPGAPERAPSVLVPDPGRSACPLYAPIAARLDRAPGWLLARSRSVGAELEEARRRAPDPTWSVEVERKEGERFSATVRGPGVTRTGSGPSPDAAVEAAWPGGLPALGPRVLAPNPEALEAACAGDAEAAWRAAGPALGTLLPELVAFPEARRSGPVFERWAYGLAESAAGRSDRAVPTLRRVVQALEREEWGPAWRRAPRSSTTAPSALTAGARGLYAFEAGTFTLLDPASGEARWSRRVGRAEPRPVEIDPSLALLVGPVGVEGIEPATGRLRWHVPLVEPHPEVAIQGDTIVLAGTEAIAAVDRATGRIRWSMPLDGPPTAGPVAAGGEIALPLETSIQLLAFLDGRTLRELALEDELSAPLLPTPSGYLWAWMGSDLLVQLDPRRRVTRVRISDLPGAEWPPVGFGERLVVLARERRRTHLHWLDPVAPRGRRLVAPAAGPIVLRPGYDGILHLDPTGRRLIGRGPAGDERLRLALPGSARALATAGARAVVGWRDRVLVVDIERGRRLHEVALGDDVRELVLGPDGGAALLEDGTVLGWPAPGDARSHAWLQEARRDLARLAFDAGRMADARRAAGAVLARDPADLAASIIDAQATFALDPGRGARPLVDLVDRLPLGAPARRAALAALAELGLEPATRVAEVPERADRVTRVPDPEARVAEVPEPRAPARVILQPGSVARAGTSTEGAPRWRTKLDLDPVHAAENEARLVVAGSSRVAGLDPVDGRLVWSLSIPGERTEGVEILDEAALVWTDRTLHRIGLEGGRREGRLRLLGPIRSRARVGAVAVVHDGSELVALDLRTPRRLGAIELAGVRTLTAGEDHVVVELGDGARWLVDPQAGLGRPPSGR